MHYLLHKKDYGMLNFTIDNFKGEIWQRHPKGSEISHSGTNLWA